MSQLALFVAVMAATASVVMAALPRDARWAVAATVAPQGPVLAQAEAPVTSVPQASSNGSAGDVSAPQSAPRATQIEPVVAPVKRVAPKTPVLAEPVKTAPDRGADKTGSKSDRRKKTPGPVVSSRPNCDPGFKVDDAGKACVKARARTAGKQTKR